MLSAKLCGVVDQLIVNVTALIPEMFGGPAKIDPILQEDPRGYLIEARGPVTLIFKCLIAQFVEPVKDNGAG
ncbi:hypothetical protein PsB1_0106 [Candidatus Phycosocius spiralis]|uniref:Uncharacterized protein n=1 Tax=Candidatus Phycosocius spiralis TaxID=2815099 RepID=A0ABQ4PSI4_9PROT|nr:hypothetical protein PsB1_0106 [Candidatus Phycosocius spiralis]